MATLESVSHRDALDIVFANRNRAYGAYQLRRAYPNYLGRAFGLGLLFIGLMIVGPRIFSAVASAFPDPPVEVVISQTEIVLDVPPPTPPPPVPPTPPPPTKPTIAFKPPVVMEDPLVQEEPPKAAMDELEKSKAEIGDKTRDGDDDAPPTDIDIPDPGPLVESKAPEPEEPTYQMFDIHKPPSFPGGERELLKYLAENIKYPPLAREINIQGSVALQFVVGKDGSVSQIEVLKDPGGGLGKEAVRVVQAMPKWNPGEANGHPVKVRFTLPVRFKLE